MRDPDLLMTLPERADPAHAALLVVDMQNDFCAKGGYIEQTVRGDVSGSEAVANAINPLVDAARARGVPIIWIRATYDWKDLAGPQLVKYREAGFNAVCCAEGTWGADWFMVKPAPGEEIVTKHRYSAFVGTNLDDLLRARRIRSLVVTGVATNVCVDSTLRDGFLRGYYIIVPKEAVGCGNQALHEATLKNVGFLLGDVISYPDVIDLWGAKKARAA